jgi:hypothetical protein
MWHSLQLGEVRQAAKKFTAYPPSIAEGRGLFLAQHKPRAHPEQQNRSENAWKKG